MNKLFVVLSVYLALTSFVHASERLVVAGGSLTEIVYALGAQDNLVGRDTSSVYPFDVHQIPDVGYYRTLNTEGLLSVAPDTLILLKGAGPQSVLTQIHNIGVKTVLIDNPKTVEGLFTSIEQVAAATGTQGFGQQLVQQLKIKLEKIAHLPSLQGKRAAFLMSAGERGLIAAGQDTTPQLIFDQLNVQNPFAGVSGFKPVSSEALASNPPDLILLASHTSRGTDVESLCQSSQLKLWASINGCNLVKIDSLKFLGLTPRLPEAIAETHTLMHTL